MRAVVVYLFFVGLVCGQVVKPTSVVLGETKRSVLQDGQVLIPEGISNFRLFLKYSAKKAGKVEISGKEIGLPVGEDVVADVTAEHVVGKDAVVHLALSGDPTRQRFELEGTKMGGGLDFTPKPGKDFPMGEEFTVMARFVLKTGGDGTLVAKAPSKGKWVAGGKSLFVRDGKLVFDIGWKGELVADQRVDDGREHIAMVTARENGEITVYLDGKEVAQAGDFNVKDVQGMVFKVGETATDFGGKLKKGEVSQVLFWKRCLSREEVGKFQKVDELNTPDFHWKAGKKKDGGRLVKYGVVEGYEMSVKVEGVQVKEAWIQPLEKSDHAELVRSWDSYSVKRGEVIYKELCVTCHGDKKVEGSIPLAPKFHTGVVKNGEDPFRMWQTLTKGYGMMAPMPQYTTKQKYDVINYIREAFLKEDNPKMMAKVDQEYLQDLPRGMSLVTEKESSRAVPKYELMDFGNYLFWTYQIEPGPLNREVNIAQKGVAIRLDEGLGGVSKGKAWAIYDHDTMRLAAIYQGDRFVDWKGIAFDGSHGTHTSIVGERVLVNEDKPGWANPKTGSWDPVRIQGKDGRLFGPLPKDWVKFGGLVQGVGTPTLIYNVGGKRVFESVRMDSRGFIRTMIVSPHDEDWKLRVKKHDGGEVPKGFVVEDGALVLKVPGSKEVKRYAILVTKVGQVSLLDELVPLEVPTPNTVKRPPMVVKTQIMRGDESGAFAVDRLTVPVAEVNPHGSWMRTSGFDFYEDGKRAAVCTWMGDVWIVEGIDQLEGELVWKRICSGLFQPLGLKIVKGEIFVICRDQLVKLKDVNGDERIDALECFNNDHQVTEHFHEFAMGLQTDGEGNFYYAKSARHAKDSLVPHHGTLLKISADGSQTDILATGFRAANGVCLNPDGSFIVTDQEGHWNPKNRINWVKGAGPKEFFGNVYGYSPVTDKSDEAMVDPLCWITNSFDRSPSELVWVPKNAGWGSLNGQLLNLSYGYGKIYVVPHRQGGMCELPLKQFPTGIMRGRFHRADGQLYGCGMFAWAGTQRKAGGFYRIRRLEKEAYLPVKLETKEREVVVTFSESLPSEIEVGDVKVSAWDLKRTARYGSKHFNQREWKVAGVKVEGLKVTLAVPELVPTWGMSIAFGFKDSGGQKVKRVIHNSVFEVGK